MTAPALFSHQRHIADFIQESRRALVFADPGCVSADTEYLTPTGWKRIDRYTPGEQVAQFHPDTKAIEFVAPAAYIKRPCDTMIAIAPARGTSQRLSHEHRVLCYDHEGDWAVQSAREYMADLHKRGPSHLRRKFATTFRTPDSHAADISPAEIRVMVATIADGHMPRPHTRHTVVRVKKGRKKARLKCLLEAAKIAYRSRDCGGQPDFEVVIYKAPRGEKTFTAFWWSMNPAQLAIAADELKYWDASRDERSDESFSFSSYIRANADFAQYALAANGYSTSLKCHSRSRRGKDEHEYVVIAYKNGGLVGPGQKTSVYEVPNEEGYKYCFEVPSSFLLLRHNGYIFATGNTGKTAAVLTAIKESGKSAVVFCPKSIMVPAWVRDCEKFTPELSIEVATAPDHNRKTAFSSSADIVVINHDGVKWLAKNRQHLTGFDFLAIDESTAYKNKDSARSKAIASLKDHFDYRVAMTGTPMSNGLLDIWHQTFLIDDGEHLGSRYYAFRAATHDPVHVTPDIKQWEPKEGALEVVADMIAPICLRYTLEECIDIPPNHTYTHYFDLSTKLQRYYDLMERDALLALENGEVEALNAASLVNKLLQIASGAVYGEREAYALGDERYDLIAELVTERPHPCVIGFTWKHQRNGVLQALERAGISNYAVLDGDHNKNVDDIVGAFQAGKYRALVVHPQTAGHGLTLTKARTTILASPIWNAEHYKQLFHRIYRAGQTEKTETIIVAARNTADERVIEKFTGKLENQTTALDLLKALMPIHQAA